MKVWNYIVIFTAMILVLEFIGMPTGLSSMLTKFGITINPNAEKINADVSNSNYYLLILSTLAISVGGAIVVSFFTKNFDTRLATLPILTTVFVAFMSTGWVLIQYVNDMGEFWLTGIITILFVPLTIGYAMSVVDYFNGYG